MLVFLPYGYTQELIFHVQGFKPYGFYLTCGWRAAARKKYTCLDLLAAVLMSIGLAAFILTDTKISPSFSITGVVLISVALLFDAIVGNVQEQAMATYATPNSEINPEKTYGYGAVFSFLGYLGVQMVLTLIGISDAFIAVVVTTCRKAISIILSFLVFTKPFSFQYIWSGAMVLLGVFLHAYSKKLARQQRLPLTTREAQL
ncbi:hypothetical protein V5799_010346 [Amblyomma americanum]|uniref:Adenosine 3'-phospho 5'-phosphosulfate transporter 2 n=1 Tax=Amblyomma americanum TaxID=6943 RepID=A0AAQ4F7X0_AMBAM